MVIVVVATGILRGFDMRALLRLLIGLFAGIALTASIAAAKTGEALIMTGNGFIDDESGPATIPVTVVLPPGLTSLAGTLEIRYDPNVVTATECAIASGLTGACNPAFETDGTEPDAARLSIVDIAPEEGELIVANLTFAGVRDGHTVLQPVVVVLSDGENDIPFETEMGAIEVDGLTNVAVSRFGETGPTFVMILAPTLALILLLLAVRQLRKRRRAEGDQ